MSWKDLGFSQKLTRLTAALGLSAFVTAMNGCEGLTWNEAELASRVRDQGEIRVLTLEHPLIHQARRPQQAQGLDTDLLKNFAATYGLKLRFVIKKDLDQIHEALAKGEGDMAAARLWVPSYASGFLSGPALEESHLSLFCRRPLKVANIRDLSGRRVLIAAKDNMNLIDVRLRQFVADVRLTVEPDVRPAALLHRAQAGKADCVVAENLEGAWYLRTMPGLEKVTSLTDDEGLAWVLRPNRGDLADLMKAWFQRASREDEIMRIQDRYRSALIGVEPNDVRRFLVNLREKFPRYAKAFRSSAKEHQLDWKLVASVAYQESHWNEEATSFTGVRGLMQLTQDTAAHVGIEDRLDPEQSIWGGAAYLRFLIDRMPAGIEPDERLLLALAAYNSGIAHLRDVQALAVDRGLNPMSWRHLKTLFPLLEDPEIARELPAGGARGRETVQFVERVRAFQSLWHLLN